MSGRNISWVNIKIIDVLLIHLLFYPLLHTLIIILPFKNTLNDIYCVTLHIGTVGANSFVSDMVHAFLI